MRELLTAILRGEATEWPAARPDAELRFLESALYHGVEPLVAWRLRGVGAFERWPATIRTGLRSAAARQAMVEELLHDELSDILMRLAETGIHPLVMKGAGLAYTHYVHPCLRPRSDTDLLIRAADTIAAIRVLESRGYARPNRTSGELVSYQSPFVKTDRHGVRHVYDLHWKIANPQLFADFLLFDELEADAIPVVALGTHARTLGHVHALLLACVHRVAHHHDADQLIWLYDIHLLASGIDQRQAHEFARWAADKRVAAICAASVARAQQEFNTGLDVELLDKLRATGDEPSRGYLRHRRRQVEILASDLGALPRWRSRLQLLRELAFPPAPYMLDTYGVSSLALLPPLYIHRLVRGIGRWCRNGVLGSRDADAKVAGRAEIDEA